MTIFLRLVILATSFRSSAAAVALAAVPVRLSDVSLRGDWGIAQERDQEVLMGLNISQYACHFTTTANLTSCTADNCITPGGPGKPLCDPLPHEMGLGGYYGHYQGHWLSSMSFLINNTGNATLKAQADSVIETFQRVMEAWKSKYGFDGYLFPYDPLVFTERLLKGHGAGPYYSVPFYTLHKLMAGLLDQHVYAGSQVAFDMVKKMAAWVHTNVEATLASGGEELWQRVLLCEWGGMNDVLYNLYSHTGDATHLATARRFNGWVFTAPLAVGEDDLADLPFPHANFHLPEIVGNARAYELTGNQTDRAVTQAFFDSLTTNHSYATAGSNSGECWQQPQDLGAFLDDQTEESCTQYNVLKIARHMFQWDADPSYADFYEQAILNGIIGNQNRQDRAMTSYIYMLPLGGVQKKPWGASNWSFRCCWGTLSESFAKLSDSIYFTSPSKNAVYVNQFVSSSVMLDHLGVKILQDASFPVSPSSTTTLTISHLGDAILLGVEFDIMVRVPKWLKQKGSITVNGQKEDADIVPGSFYKLQRAWKDGDVIEVAFPMSLWTNPLNDHHPIYNATLAFMFGPFVLAGVDVTTDIFVPKGEQFKSNPETFIQRTSDSALEFQATSKNGTAMRMIPLHDVMLESYVVYFMTAGTKPPQPRNGYCPHSQRMSKPLMKDEVKKLAYKLDVRAEPKELVV